MNALLPALDLKTWNGMLETVPAALSVLLNMSLRRLLPLALLFMNNEQVVGQNAPPPTNTTGIYNSSTTPSNLPWNTYNYCNSPHVNARHYTKPSEKGAKLVYMNVMIRHHKRTPDNLYPVENPLNPAAGWKCTEFLQENHANGSARVSHETVIPASHPFLSQIWNGTCDMGQLTEEGLEDAMQHGKDFWGVYGEFLGGKVSEETMWFRTTVSDRTYQTTGGLLAGMGFLGPFNVVTEPANIESLTPSYSCPFADNVRNAYQSVPAWTDHLVANEALQIRLGQTTGTLGLSAWTSWYDHYFDTFTSRTCHGHPLPCNSTGACVSQADATQVFSIGDFEYNYIWNAAQNSTIYNQLTFGVMINELRQNFANFKANKEPFKLRFHVGHDGSLIRLAAILGLGNIADLRWPGLGSEMVMEVWETTNKEFFVRVFHEGTPVQTLEWVTLDDFIDLLASNVPADIFNTCMSA